MKASEESQTSMQILQAAKKSKPKVKHTEELDDAFKPKNELDNTITNNRVSGLKPRKWKQFN